MSFGFSSIGHFFAAAFSDLHKAEQFVLAQVPKIQKLEPVVEGVTVALGGGQFVVIERAAFSALGFVLSLTHQLIVGDEAAQKAAGAKLADLGLDQAAIAAFKQLIIDAKADLAKLGYTV